MAVGAIQVTPDGTLIIIGPDGPTIGGYPVVAYVIDADLDRVGQLLPGTSCVLEMVSFATAQELASSRRRRIEQLLRLISLNARAATP